MERAIQHLVPWNFSLDAFSKILACLLLGICSEAYGDDLEIRAYEQDEARDS